MLRGELCQRRRKNWFAVSGGREADDNCGHPVTQTRGEGLGRRQGEDTWDIGRRGSGLLDERNRNSRWQTGEEPVIQGKT